MAEEKQYQNLCDEIRNIKFKYWTPPEETEIDEAVKEELKKDAEKSNINFYKGDIKSVFDRNNRKVACIGFPKDSMYAGYVWFYPADWIKDNKDNAEKRWVTIKNEYKVTIVKSAKNANGKFETVDEKEITPQELKEAMKRKQK